MIVPFEVADLDYDQAGEAFAVRFAKEANLNRPGFTGEFPTL